MQRVELIRQRLQAAFSPQNLEVIDDSEKHKGHAGAAGGAGHYTVIITADCFQDVSRIEAHRKIYSTLDDLIPREVHALVIKIIR
jgi:BolA family transcriptional regulator, general stress-responsive regulator